MDNPLVSIIIPVYNAEKYLAETINSAIAQTWSNKEIIIVDDGSTDNSLAIAQKFENNWIKIFKQENKGASAARNKGLLEAKGDYIQFLDGDDLLSYDKIEQQVSILKKNQDKVAVCSTVHFFDGQDYLNYKPSDYEKGFLIDSDPVNFLINLWGGFSSNGSMVTIHAWLTPKNIIDKAGCWNEKLTVDDDGEYFCRVLLASKGVKFSPQGINYYRKFEKSWSLSSKKTEQAYQSRLLSIDLKYEHLKSKTDIILLKKTLSKYYWEIGVACFPQFIKLSSIAIQKAKQFGYYGPKHAPGQASILSQILGWRLLRIISFIKHGF